MTTPFFKSPVEINENLRQMKLFRGAGEDIGPALRKEYEILDAHATTALKVNTRLDAEHHAGHEDVRTSRGGQPRRLVDFQANSVPGSVRELVPKAVSSYGLPGDAIHFGACHSRSDAADCLLLGID